MDALKNENELSEQIKKLAEHLTFIERKIDQLLEARDRQPAYNENPRREFQQRPGGFRPSGGPGGGFRPQRPGGFGGQHREGRGGQGRPQGGGHSGGHQGGHQGGGKPFYSKYAKNQHRG